MIKIAVIVGSTRPNRFADVPTRWILDGARKRHDLTVDVLDLRDQALPFFEEPVPPAATGGQFSSPAAEAWRQKLAGFDGFIIVAAEYNHGPTASLKNALDSALVEWANKPVAFVGYGGVGGARAVEQLRLTAIELQMAPIRNAVHIALEPYLGVVQEGRTLDSYGYLKQSRAALFDQLVWWAAALQAARNQGAHHERRLRAAARRSA